MHAFRVARNRVVTPSYIISPPLPDRTYLPSPSLPWTEQIYTRAAMDTDPPSYCTMFHHMVKNGGTSIRNQLVSSAEAQGRDTPGDGDVLAVRHGME